MKFQLIGWMALAALKVTEAAFDLNFCDEDRIRIRPNIMHMSEDRLKRYFDAVKKLNSGPRPTKWDQYAKMHVDYYDQIHSDPKFYVWHRFFLYFVEKDLQAIDPSVVIPYWDWTVHADNPNADPIYSDKYFGKVNGNGWCVNSGPFKDFRVSYYHDGSQNTHCLIRKNRFDETVTNGKTMDTFYLNKPTIKEFAEGIEYVPHGRIHNGIGGEFSGHASPGDPLFFSHHAFIDKLWFDWSRRNLDKADTYHLNKYQVIQPFGHPVIRAIDTFDRMCYAYKEEHFPWSTNEVTQRTMLASPTFEAAPYKLPNNVTTTEELDAHDLKFVTSKLEPENEAAAKKIDIAAESPNPNPKEVEKHVKEAFPDQIIKDFKLLDAGFISMMGFDIAKVRQLEQQELETKQFNLLTNKPEPKAGTSIPAGNNVVKVGA